VKEKMSEVASVSQELLDALAEIGKQGDLGESVVRVWSCILFKSCPISKKEIEEGTGYSSGLVSLSLRKLKIVNMINEIYMGGEKRYYVNTSLTDAFDKFSRHFFVDNIKPMIALLSENLDKIENVKVKKALCELIDECKKLSPLVLIISRVIEDINSSEIPRGGMKRRNGIKDFTRTFRNSIADIKEGSKLVFAGSVSVCTPFVELLAYAVRDRGFDMLYVPRTDAKEARKIKKIENIGYSVVDEKGDPRDPDVVVVLGGLAIPKFGCSPDEVLRLIEDISGKKRPKIIGINFMNVFELAGWDKKINFDTVIEGD
jgi:DNA-binding transcriptional regulator GbsR (MarR family)